MQAISLWRYWAPQNSRWSAHYWRNMKSWHEQSLTRKSWWACNLGTGRTGKVAWGLVWIKPPSSRVANLTQKLSARKLSLKRRVEVANVYVASVIFYRLTIVPCPRSRLTKLEPWVVANKVNIRLHIYFQAELGLVWWYFFQSSSFHGPTPVRDWFFFCGCF